MNDKIHSVQSNSVVGRGWCSAKLRGRSDVRNRQLQGSRTLLAYFRVWNRIVRINK